MQQSKIDRIGTIKFLSVIISFMADALCGRISSPSTVFFAVVIGLFSNSNKTHAILNSFLDLFMLNPVEMWLFWPFNRLKHTLFTFEIAIIVISTVRKVSISLVDIAKTVITTVRRTSISLLLIAETMIPTVRKANISLLVIAKTIISTVRRDRITLLTIRKSVISTGWE